MEANQKKKFVCKYCNKRYPCGKSLGGHIRTHMNNGNSAEAEGEAKLNIDKIFSGRNIKKDSGLETGAQSGYVLRQNPKKTKRFVDSRTLTLQQEMVCKECGKGFQSLKALCGHMACHSEKEMPRTSFEDHIKISDVKQKLVMDSESDTETSAPRRSKGTGYTTVGVYASSVDVTHGSSSVSGIEQEQEEVAMCLMMLSRDSSACKKGLNSFADSSDNNSVVLEAKSSSIEIKISAKNGVNYVSKGNEFVEKKNAENSKSKSAEIDVSDNSDSGYFRNGPKKAESDASVDGFYRTGKFKKSGVEYESGFEYYDAKLEKSSIKRTEFGRGFPKEEDFAQVDTRKYGSKKRAKNDSPSPEFFRTNAQKGNDFECSTCNKVFHSHRSLWGHTASHSKTNGCCESINESSENSIETYSFLVRLPCSKVNKSGNGKNPTEHHSSSDVEKKLVSKKSKGHECPFCFRVFKSGQALGGHKRSHFVGGSENKTVVIKQELDKMPGLIDLNLPAPVEEEAIGDAEFAGRW